MDSDVVVRTALGIRITTKQLAALEAEFYRAEDAAAAALSELNLLHLGTHQHNRTMSTLSTLDGGGSVHEWRDTDGDGVTGTPTTRVTNPHHRRDGSLFSAGTGPPMLRRASVSSQRSGDYARPMRRPRGATSGSNVGSDDGSLDDDDRDGGATPNGGDASSAGCVVHPPTFDNIASGDSGTSHAGLVRAAAAGGPSAAEATVVPSPAARSRRAPAGAAADEQ